MRAGDEEGTGGQGATAVRITGTGHACSPGVRGHGAQWTPVVVEDLLPGQLLP